MSAAIRIPDILDTIALAGPSGCEFPADPDVRREIDLCREWGFQVRTTHDGKVVLPRNDDLLVPAWIQEESVSRSWERLTVAGYLTAESTNDEASSLARLGASSGLLVIAERQTAGKGRKGRRWNSPPKAGLYFSLVVRPSQPVHSWPILTHVAALALVETFRCTATEIGAPLEIDLKWPNDVLLSGRKASGILLETAGSTGASAAVVGVGINVAPAAVPEELRASATSIADETGVVVPRRTLLVKFLEQFQLLYNAFENGEHRWILDLWKACSSMWNGIPVTIIDGENPRAGVTCGLTDSGALRVRLEGGREETILSGEVTIRRRAGS